MAAGVAESQHEPKSKELPRTSTFEYRSMRLYMATVKPTMQYYTLYYILYTMYCILQNYILYTIYYILYYTILYYTILSGPSPCPWAWLWPRPDQGRGLDSELRRVRVPWPRPLGLDSSIWVAVKELSLSCHNRWSVPFCGCPCNKGHQNPETRFFGKYLYYGKYY